MKTTSMLLAALAIAAGTASAEENKFEKDRAAILAMAGDFKVGFRFQETLSLRADYAIKPDVYEESAYETVKLVEDTGRRIVLQHLLQVGDRVVKHWGQIWTYEDTEILEYQGGRKWITRTLAPEEAAGRWTQRVTQVDDTPRYEGIGRWVHHPESSEWSATANRPLPRREHTKRDDYDLLLATNRHTVTRAGWFHEQDNTKWVKRDGRSYPLCREIGFNPYLRVEQHDFSEANEFWKNTAAFWADVRKVWEELQDEAGITLRTKSDDGRIFDVMDELVERAEDGDPPPVEELRETLGKFVVKEAPSHQ